MRLTILSLTIALGMFAATASQAQTVVTTSPGEVVTYQGVVSEINPTASTIILQSPAGAGEPVTYTYTPQTVFVDSMGNTVSYEAIRNLPVKIEYVKDGGRTVVRRVVTTTVVQPK